MTQAEIICMAREAGFEVDEGLFPFEAAEDKYIGTERTLERFAALVAAHEREKIPKDFVKACEVLVQEKIDAVLAERDRMCKQFNIPMELANETAASNEAD